MRKGSEIKNEPKWTERQIKALRNPDKACWVFLDQIDLLRKNKSDEGLQFDLVDDLLFNIVKKHDMVVYGTSSALKIEISSSANFYETELYNPNWRFGARGISLPEALLLAEYYGLDSEALISAAEPQEMEGQPDAERQEKECLPKKWPRIALFNVE